MVQTLQSSIEQLTQRRDLSEREAQAVIGSLMRGEAAEHEIAALLTAWKDKGVTVEELTGAAQASRAAATRLSVRPGPLVDTCGTGGDRLGTFNISTVAALIAAGAGVRVAKHGNRGATSVCGSADLLATLGVKIDPEPSIVARCIDEIGLGFLFAPRFHPAMRHVAAVRRQLPFRTIFNLLGPLTNPAGVTHQVIGVSESHLTNLMAEVLGRLGVRHALVVHGQEGLDEVSPVGPTLVVELVQGKTVTYTVTPEQFGFMRTEVAALAGGEPAASARIAREILNGVPGPHRDAALFNAGCVLYAAEAAADIEAGVSLARQALDNGGARRKLEALIRMTNT